MIRKAKAHWMGNLKDGEGTLSTESNILQYTNYSYKTRFENGVIGTNPEELLAAAHAGCFTMAVVAMLTQKSMIPTSLDTEASVTIEGLHITEVHLSISGTVPGLTASDFTIIAQDAEKNCLISKVLNIPISSEAHLKT